MRKTKYPLVAIIVLNWNGKKLLKTCLSSLFKLTDYPNYQVIVVDNGSTDGSVEYVRKHFPKADVLALGKNYGFAKGNNIGIRYALKKYNPDYILLLNNDTKIIQKYWLTEMIKIAESDKKIGIVGCKMFSPIYKVATGRVLIFRKNISDYNKTCDVDTVSGACMLISRNLIFHIGLLDEIYSPFCFEDTDYCLRARKRGFRIVYHGKAAIIHLKGCSMKKQEPLYRFFVKTKNGLIFTFRYLPILEKIREILKFSFKAFISKKDESKPLKSSNLYFHKDFLPRFFLFIYAFFLALRICYNFQIQGN